MCDTHRHLLSMSLYCVVGTSTVVGDPHFMITDPRSKEHFCFDYGGDDGENLVLVDDTDSGTNIDGHLIIDYILHDRRLHNPNYGII